VARLRAGLLDRCPAAGPPANAMQKDKGHPWPADLRGNAHA
jgi:hypothetical protein